MNVRLNAMAAMALLLAGCETTSRVMLGPTYPAITPEQVQIYYQPPARYREVALLETASGSFTYGEQHKMDAVLAKLRIEAAKLGANGVLFQGTETGYGGSNVGVGVGGGNYGGQQQLRRRRRLQHQPDAEIRARHGDLRHRSDACAAAPRRPRPGALIRAAWPDSGGVGVPVGSSE